MPRATSALMARVRAGAEVVIEDGSQAIAVLHSPAPPRRSISESIALAEARSKELGYEPVMDAEFAADMEEIIRNRKPRDRSAWD
jgi:antitoxin (DNA-binding transcriptional repressor) of toxin-antitoxin stability system